MVLEESPGERDGHCIIKTTTYMATKTKDQYISPDCEDAGNQSLVPVKVIIPLAAVLTQVVCSNGTSQSRKMEEVLVVYQGEDLNILIQGWVRYGMDLR